jgi:hypothetical protein
MMSSGGACPTCSNKEFQDRQKRGRDVEFLFVDGVMFMASAAASGVVGNFTNAAIMKAFKAIRRPKQ